MTKLHENDAGEPRLFTEDTLLIATHNKGKLSELRRYFEPMGITLLSADDVNLPEPEETEETFKGNALLKARAGAFETGHVCLADDSGLAVDALHGAPGIYSARWAVQDDGSRDFDKAMERIRLELGESENRAAKFVCAVALVWPDGHEEVVEGEVTGHLEFPPRGERGFGYDPIFVPEEETRTFGEMLPEEKEPISHRTAAIDIIIDQCFR